MANPAELLLDLFLSWNEVSGSPKEVRTDSPDLETHRRAVQHLNDIEQILNAMANDGKRTASFRRSYAAWVQNVFNYPQDWTYGSHGKISQHYLDVLESLIDYIDEYLPTFDEKRFDDLKIYLEQVEKLLVEDSSLNSKVVASCRAMIQNLRTVIDQYHVRGDCEFEQCLRNLLGSLALITLQSAAKDKWKKLLDAFVFPYAVNNIPRLDSGGLIQSLFPGS